MAKIEAALLDVRFAWNGRVDGSRSIYYRIQGPNLIIEFSTEGSVGASGVGVPTRKVTDAIDLLALDARLEGEIAPPPRSRVVA